MKTFLSWLSDSSIRKKTNGAVTTWQQRSRNWYLGFPGLILGLYMLGALAWIMFGPAPNADDDLDGPLANIFAGMIIVGTVVVAVVIITISLRKILPQQRLRVDLATRTYRWQLLFFFPLKASKGQLDDCIIELYEAVKPTSLPLYTMFSEEQSAHFRDPKQNLLVPIYQGKGADLLDVGRHLEAEFAIPCHVGSAPILMPSKPAFPQALRERPPALVEVTESSIVLTGTRVNLTSEMRMVIHCSDSRITIANGARERIPMTLPGIDLRDVRKFAYGIGSSRHFGALYVCLETCGWQRVFYGYDEATTRWVVNWLTARLVEFRTESQNAQPRVES